MCMCVCVFVWVQHPVLVPLLQSLGEDSAQVVQSCCHVLVKASTEQGWVCHRQVLHELVSRAAVSPSFSVLLEAATSLMIHDMNTATPTKYSIRSDHSNLTCSTLSAPFLCRSLV